MNEIPVSEQEGIRRDKLKALQAEGLDPFMVNRFNQQMHSVDVLERYDELDGKPVSVAGRLMTRRVMGKASFAHLLDLKGLLQIYVRRDDLGEDAYARFKQMDIGDILGVSGTVFRTKSGEVSVHAESVTLLSKSLKVLPEKFHGLRDPELRYRQRAVDLI
ncbi:MAG: OB-fold nucleic acid binding domain-containing protein, partial [Clostridia bacterium]|nr:OB-fold nucleic acid binding domain-containing protein [Clostridia bacterium]